MFYNSSRFKINFVNSFSNDENLFIKCTSRTKEEYARTRARDSKHLPAVILNVFLLNRVIMFNIFKSILKISFTRYGFM